MRRQLKLLAMGTTAALLVSCGGGGSSSPAETVQNYLEAKVEGDAETIRGLICVEMEGLIAQEAASFASVEARLEDASCAQSGTDGAYTLVLCTGQIVATYGTEDTSFPLGTYRAVEEDGEWKWCGEG